MLIILIAVGFMNLFSFMARREGGKPLLWGLLGFTTFLLSYFSAQYISAHLFIEGYIAGAKHNFNSTVLTYSILSASALTVFVLFILYLINRKKKKARESYALDEEFIVESQKKRISFRK